MSALNIILGLVTILAGLIMCFKGEHWSKIVVFFIAFAAMFYIMNNLLTDIENDNTRLIICAAVGLVAGILTLFLYNWAPLLIGAGVGVVFAMNFDFGIEAVHSSQMFYYIYVIAVAVIFALLCHILKTVMVKIATGLCGAAFIVGGAMYLYNVLFNKISTMIVDYLQLIYSISISGQSVTVPIIATLIIGVLGTLVQFGIIGSPLHK